jgi:hypothetical protein
MVIALIELEFPGILEAVIPEKYSLSPNSLKSAVLVVPVTAP